MLEADEAEGLIDWDFLNRCTVGFDAEHMPSDAKQQTNFKDYVQGAYDNTPKTPEWASEICGASPEAIRNLARAMGKDHKVGFLVSTASARINNTDNLPPARHDRGRHGRPPWAKSGPHDGFHHACDFG